MNSSLFLKVLSTFLTSYSSDFQRNTEIFGKNLHHGFEKSADLLSKCQNRKEDFFKSCVLLKKSELYQNG